MGEESRKEMGRSAARRRTVPVKHRDNLAARDRSSARTVRRREPLAAGHYVALAAALLVAVLSIAGPAHNYFDQRREIADLQSSIAAQQQRKSDLQLELEQFNSPAYREEQIRRRLSAIAEGEVPFRIVDPAISTNDAVTTEHKSPQAVEQGPWYEVLWASLVDAKSIAPGLNDENDPAKHDPSAQLPIEAPAPDASAQ